MCTAFSMNNKDHYFGRNLDLDVSYGEEVCVMPRRFRLYFRRMGEMSEHYAMIGMATIAEGIPLFYEAANEHGLGMAGLNFPGNAHYFPIAEGKDNVAPFEFIPWILGQCKTVAEAKELLGKINLCDISFSEALPLSPLHWIISDSKGSIVVESRKSGLFVHENPVGVLTNNPPFEYQLRNLEKYSGLRADNSGAQYEENPEYTERCQGLGAVGLPGDVSSMSRFVRAAFALENSVAEPDELSSVGQFFHLLGSVEMLRGICKTDAGSWDITGYSACINTSKGLYYYTTYDNRRIACVDMHKTDLESESFSRFPLRAKQDIEYLNQSL